MIPRVAVPLALPHFGAEVIPRFPIWHKLRLHEIEGTTLLQEAFSKVSLRKKLERSAAAPIVNSLQGDVPAAHCFKLHAAD